MSLAAERYDENIDNTFDTVMLLIQKGEIKCGRYAHLSKVNNSLKFKDGILFKNEKEEVK